MRRLGLPWREALLIVVVAVGLATSIVLFAATAPAFRGTARAEVDAGMARRPSGEREDLENTAAANSPRHGTDFVWEEKSHDE